MSNLLGLRTQVFVVKPQEIGLLQNGFFYFLFLSMVIQASPGLWATRSHTALREGNRVQAIKYMYRALEESSLKGSRDEIARVRLNLLDLYLEEENLPQMRNHLDTLNGPLSPELKIIFHWKQAQVHIMQGQYILAQKILEDAYVNCPQKSKCQFLLSDLLLCQLMNLLPKKSKDFGSINLSELPEGATKSQLLGKLDFFKGQYPKAIANFSEAAQFYQKAKNFNHYSRCLFWIALSYTRNGQFGEARDFLQRALAIAQQLKLPLAAMRMSLLNIYIEQSALQNDKQQDFLQKENHPLHLNPPRPASHERSAYWIALGEQFKSENKWVEPKHLWQIYHFAGFILPQGVLPP